MTFSIEDIYDTDEHGGRAGPHPLDCTCGARAPHYHSPEPGIVEARPTYDLECPVHGLDALLAQAAPGLDIDEADDD